MCINSSANVNDLKMQFLILKVFIRPRKMKYLPDNVSCRKANIAGESVFTIYSKNKNNEKRLQLQSCYCSLAQRPCYCIYPKCFYYSGILSTQITSRLSLLENNSSIEEAIKQTRVAGASCISIRTILEAYGRKAFCGLDLIMINKLTSQQSSF